MARRMSWRWPSPEETGEVYICYPADCVPPADTDERPVLTCAGTLAEARKDAKGQGGAAIYVCDFHVRSQAGGGNYADNERFVEVVED